MKKKFFFLKLWNINKGLWEPGLNLNPFILSYFAFIYEKYEKDFEKQQEKEKKNDEEEMEEVL